MGVLQLFVVALMPVLKVLIVTAVGLFLALERINLLSAESRKYLNNLVFYVFNTSLIVSNLSDTVTAESFATLWFMPLNILITFILGSILAWVLIQLTRAPQNIRSLIIGTCSAGNLGNLLLIILPAVCDETNSPFGDSTTCAQYGKEYASLSMAVGAIYIWFYVYTIMRISAEMRTDGTDGNSPSSTLTAEEDSSGSVPGTLTETLLVMEGPSDHDQGFGRQELPPVESPRRTKVSCFSRVRQRISNTLKLIDMKKLLAPSTIAAIIGFFIGIVSPIRKLLIGSSAPLRVVYSSTAFLGQVAVPCITLIIGANLLQGLKGSGVGAFVIIGVIVIRYIIMPLIGIGIVKGMHSLGMVGSDPLYIFTLLLQYALPPAMNVGTITQLLQTGQSECSVILMWTYVVAAFTLTFWSTVFLWLVA
ncbi:hypothetical protein MLD38_010860 [Melastoma candidum]|uniref:Uncharacterized protein n=1 Tax=Melastoma candidum TaxID=119954 RepID=A0ACB9R0V5_9MYRT|nr:hypothetical protein MLD38_010860 [Melastoma candidum]